MKYTASGSVTAGTVTLTKVDLDSAWWRYWAREWGDIGRLYQMQETEEHIPMHDVRWATFATPYCACFSCRVLRAWEGSKP